MPYRRKGRKSGFTKEKARLLLRALNKMPGRRAGRRGGMSEASKRKARATIRRKFKSL